MWLMNFHYHIFPTAYEEEVQEEIDQLEDDFEKIQRSLMATLKDQGIEVQNFTTKITCTPVQRKYLKSLEKTNTIEDIFDIWNDNFVWSFLDYTSLEHIVKRLGSNELKGLMKRYSNKMKEFRRKTKALTLIKVWDSEALSCDHMHHRKECRELLVELKKDPDKYTLADLEQIRRGVARLRKGIKNLSLAEAAVVLWSLKHGSIISIWIVPINLVEQFKNAFKECIAMGAFFIENNITRVELDGDVFMPNEEVRNSRFNVRPGREE